ncbi:hypothetical protein B0H11DRAFT_1737509 [Mycena galericulata]|nr:hypothetical protein B0H11DRAFT_1737509 [Mycena galericulata]
MSPSPSPRCEYNIQWMDRTFRDPKASEKLLSAELENGNLTRRDYDRIMANLPGFQYSDAVGPVTSGVASILYSRYRRPNFAVVMVGYMVGDLVGRGARIWTHQRCFLSIENVEGFSRAMDNVKRQVGYKPGLISLTRPLLVSDGESAFQREFEPASTVAPTADPPSALPATTQTPLVKSRWDEIRARRADGPNKAWENIRQGRRPDGTPVPRRSAPQSRNDTNDQPSPFRDDDRAAAQASFDAMLERERNKSSS